MGMRIARLLGKSRVVESSCGLFRWELPHGEKRVGSEAGLELHSSATGEFSPSVESYGTGFPPFEMEYFPSDEF